MGAAVSAMCGYRAKAKRGTTFRGMLQHGGRILGAGVHGCTFEPAPRCAGGDVFRTVDGKPAVGKITDDDPHEELEVGRAIMALPLARQYFALPSVGCRPADRYEDPDSRRCGVITEAGLTTRLSMLIMPEAGTQLSKWADDLPRLAANYTRMFVHLLEGMLIYQRSRERGMGYVHNDIHMGNILVDDNNVARYIDFGLAFRPADVTKWSDTNLSRSFNPKHVLQAPEIHAWRMYMSGIRLADGLRQLRAAHTDYDRLATQYPARKTVDRAFSELIQTAYVEKEDVTGFMRRYGFGIDHWRIGIVFWWMWNDMLEWSGLRETHVWEHRDKIRQVLAGLTDFDYATRITAKQALAILDPSSRMLEA